MYPVESRSVPFLWDGLEPLIAAALTKSGNRYRYDARYIYEQLLSTDMQLWCEFSDIGVRLAIITRVVIYPTRYRELECFLISGKEFDLKRALDVLKPFAKHHGCEVITGAGRKGWIRKITGVEPEYRFKLRVT